MKRRLSIICALTLAVLMVFAGCSTSKPAGKTAQKKITLSFYLNNQNQPAYMTFVKDTIIKKFETAHPNITLVLTLNNDPLGLEKQQLAAGTGPSFIYADGPTSLQLFASANYLKPLTTYVDKYKWDTRFAKWALNTCVHDGKVMGLPDGIDELLVYYNKDMFSKNGWSIPTSYDQLITLCKAIKAKNITPFAFGTSDFKQANEWWISMALNEALGNDNMKKVLTGDLAWTSPQVSDAMQKLVDMWKNGYIYPNSASVTTDDFLSMFSTQKAGLIMCGSWEATSIEDAKPGFDWGTFQMPAWNDGVTSNVPTAVGATWSINANCKDPDAAAEFLDWYYSPEVVNGYSKLGTFEPMTTFDPTKVEGLDPHMTDLLTLLGTAEKNNETGYCAWTYWPPDVETYAWDNIESVYLGQMKLNNYLSQLQSNFATDKSKKELFNFAG